MNTVEGIAMNKFAYQIRQVITIDEHVFQA